MKCPMKFSVGCSSESKECEGNECMWYMSSTPLGGDNGKRFYGCAVAFCGIHDTYMGYSINSQTNESGL